MKPQIQEILEEVVRSIVGPRCEIKDTEDFPDTKDGERCPACAAYDEVDKATAKLQDLFTKAIPEKVIRFDLVDHRENGDGRTQYSDVQVELDYQDNGTTLKVFLRDTQANIKENK